MACEEVFITASTASWTPTDTGEVVVLDLRSSSYLSLNGTGAFLWTKLAAGATRADLQADLVAEYNVTQQEADVDVAEFIRDLQDRSLIATTT